MKTYRLFQILTILLGLVLLLDAKLPSVQAAPARQETTDFAAIDSYISAQRQELGIPGMALSIVQDGEIVHLQGYGEADSSGRPVTPQTPFYIGSITKSFTALAIMQLVEEGLVDLDAPVQRYLPWFKLADNEASAQITVRHLLNQNSGISTKDGNDYWNSRLGMEDVVRSLGSVELTQPVGSTFQYSNLNFMIAGLIVEQVSGQAYGDYIREHIFQPLKMDHAFTSARQVEDEGLAEAHYYVLGRAFSSEQPLPPALLPTGFLIASVEDLAHYAIAHLNGGRFGQNSVLSPQGMAELHAPTAQQSGLEIYYTNGWNVETKNDAPTIWHDGDTGRASAIIILRPERNLGVVLQTNASGFEQLLQVNGVARGVIDLMDGKSPAPVRLMMANRVLYWTIPFILAFQIMGIAFFWLRRQQIKGWHMVLYISLNLVAVVFLFLIAQLIPFRLPSMRVFFPEVTYGLISVAILGISSSVFSSAAYFCSRGIIGTLQPTFQA